MKSDIDAIMQASNLDALIVFGNAEHNPPMYYLTGGGHVSHAVLIKKRGEVSVLFHGDMERDEAAKSGLKLIPYSKYDYDELLKQANKDGDLAGAMRMELMFKDIVGFGFDQLEHWDNAVYCSFEDIRDAELAAGWDSSP